MNGIIGTVKRYYSFREELDIIRCILDAVYEYRMWGVRVRGDRGWDNWLWNIIDLLILMRR